MTTSENMLGDGVKVNVRLHNYPESMIALKNLKAGYIGMFLMSGSFFLALFSFIVSSFLPFIF